MTAWIDEIVQKSPAKIYVAYIGEFEFLGASESDRAGRKVKLRIIIAPEAAGKINPFAKYTRRRRGFTGTRFEAAFAQINGSAEFMCEVALDNWTDSPKGSTVSLALNAEAVVHPFMGATRASKDAPGTRYMVTLVEKNDDDSLVDQEKQERAERVARTDRGQTLSNVARVLTKHQRFHDWLGEVAGIQPCAAEDADVWLKAEVGIESKTELDDDRTPESAAKIIRFHKIRQRFLDWQEAQGDDLIDR